MGFRYVAEHPEMSEPYPATLHAARLNLLSDAQRLAQLLEDAATRIGVLERENEGLRAFKRGVDEALNSGDGSYRP